MYRMGLPGGSVVKNQPANEPANQQVQTGGWEDPLEEEMATHSSILASFKFWEIPWTEEREGLRSMRSRKSQTRQSD